jgi:hypothetical protein
MGANQRIEKAVYTPDRNYRSQMYGPLLTGASSRQTPHFTGTVIGQNITEMLNSVSNTTSKVAEQLINMELSTQRRADDNAVTMATTFYNNQQSAFIPQLDNDKGKMAVDSAVNDFKNYAGNLEGVSQEGRTRLEEMQKSLAESYKSKQRFGRAKLIEQQSETIHRTNLKQAVESGNPLAVSQWVQACKDKNYDIKTNEATLQSNTAFFRLKNSIQASPVIELKTIDEELQEVDKKGNSKIYKGMQVDDLRRARREVSGLIAQKQHDSYNNLVNKIDKGEVYGIEDIQELYKKDKISLKVLQGFKKNYTSGQKAVSDKRKNELNFDIYKANQFSDPIKKKEYFNSKKENILSSGLDIPAKISLCKEIDRLQAASNKPGSDQVADSLLYGVQQLKEKVYDKLKVYETRMLWFDKEHEKKSEAMKSSELGALKRWQKESLRTLPEIDEYINNINKKYTKTLTLEGFRKHFGNAGHGRTLKMMGEK